MLEASDKHDILSCMQTSKGHYVLAQKGCSVGATAPERPETESEVRRLEQMQRLCAILMERLLSSGEQERRYLAEVLHDDAVQLGCQVERLLRNVLAFSSLPAGIYEPVAEATRLTCALLEHLRGIVVELYPPPLANAGLVPALQILLQAVEQRTGLHCSLSSDGLVEDRRLGDEQERLLYSIAREAIINVVKHAHATTLNVSLYGDGAYLYLKVQDDGEGFILQPPGDLLRMGHLGLALLQERSWQLGGTVHIDTAPGRGTTLLFSTACARRR
jgi:signal transduction histidine kinase